VSSTRHQILWFALILAAKLHHFFLDAHRAFRGKEFFPSGAQNPARILPLPALRFLHHVTPAAVFQGLEKIRENFPSFGKNPRETFQSLEKSRKNFPSPGKFSLRFPLHTCASVQWAVRWG
jgi:hypothetical protein